MQRFEFLRQPLMGELAMSPERKKERKREREKEKKMPFIVANYVYASSQGQCTHSARNKILILFKKIYSFKVHSNREYICFKRSEVNL